MLYIEYIVRAEECKRQIIHNALLYWGARHWIFYIHFHYPIFLMCALKSILSLIFQWSEVLPSFIPKQMLVNVVGTVLQVFRARALFSDFWNHRGTDEGKVVTGGRGWVCRGMLRNLMISKLVPKSGIETNWDRYNVVVPAIIGAICIVQACRQPQAGHTPAFSSPGELLEAYNSPQVKAVV